MPSIITASQLRSVLGVSSSLYSDSYLDGIINSAEGVLLPLLEAYTTYRDWETDRKSVV